MRPREANYFPHSQSPVSYLGLIKSGSRRTDNKNVAAIDHNFRCVQNWPANNARRSTYERAVRSISGLVPFLERAGFFLATPPILLAGGLS